MFNLGKTNKSILIVAATGILGLAALGFYNTAAALMEKQAQNTSNEVAAATITTATDNEQSNLTGCPGNCAVCGLCSNQQVLQSDGTTSSQISDVEIY